MATPIALTVNGRAVDLAVDVEAMPLLYALRNDLDLRGPRFGRGLGQCGACTVTSRDWESYRTIRFPEVPAIAIELIDRPGEKPWGAGEPTAAVVPSAIANAVFDATGIRLRSVPFTPQKVREAMKAI